MHRQTQRRRAVHVAPPAETVETHQDTPGRGAIAGLGRGDPLERSSLGCDGRSEVRGKAHEDS